MRTGELGHWWHSLGPDPHAYAPLRGPAEADVAIVGGGFTGLWTAYYLASAAPQLKIVVLEREACGFGASGRNGGWVSGFFSGPPRTYLRRSERTALSTLQQAMFATVTEVAERCRELGIDAELHQGGLLDVGIGRAQAAHLQEEIAGARARGLGEGDLRLLDAGAVAERIRVSGALAATFSPHAARVHPLKLARGLAAAVTRLGVQIHERTPVLEIAPRRALTPAGAISARWIVRATEGYTASLPGLRRALVPVNSSMIVTEPLPAAAWQEIGWDGGEVLSDAAHVFVYLQRTADGRIAIGGRGVPYRYGSRTDGDGATAARTVASLRRRLHQMFPATRSVAIDHAWSGVLGVSRDWCVSVDADAATGLAWAGGYAGEGVAASNLAARTLRDLILGERTELVGLPWVGRTPRRWEPEPLRWTGIRGLYSLYRLADRIEARSGRSSRLGALLDAASGRV